MIWQQKLPKTPFVVQVATNSHKNHDKNKNKLTIGMTKNDNTTIWEAAHSLVRTHDSIPSLDPSAKVHQSQAPRIRQSSGRGPQLNGLPPGTQKRWKPCLCLGGVSNVTKQAWVWQRGVPNWPCNPESNKSSAGLTTFTVSASAFFGRTEWLDARHSGQTLITAASCIDCTHWIRWNKMDSDGQDVAAVASISDIFQSYTKIHQPFQFNFAWWFWTPHGSCQRSFSLVAGAKCKSSQIWWPNYLACTSFFAFFWGGIATRSSSSRMAHLVTVEVPSMKRVRNSTFAWLNIPSFRDTTINCECGKWVRIMWPMFCVWLRSRAESISSRMYLGAQTQVEWNVRNGVSIFTRWPRTEHAGVKAKQSRFWCLMVDLEYLFG